MLPNAWDAGSARIIESAGATAIATSSAAVAWAHGYPDGQFMPFDTLLATVREMTRVVKIPVSADIEAAYAQDAATAATTVARIVEAGAVGINIEDGNDPPDLLARKIENLKTAAHKAGVELWVNARVDTYLRKLVPADRAYDETVARARLYREAGANSIFAPAVTEKATIEKLVKAVVLPLNLLAWPGLPDARDAAETRRTPSQCRFGHRQARPQSHARAGKSVPCRRPVRALQRGPACQSRHQRPDAKRLKRHETAYDKSGFEIRAAWAKTRSYGTICEALCGRRLSGSLSAPGSCCGTDLVPLWFVAGVALSLAAVAALLTARARPESGHGGRHDR